MRELVDAARAGAFMRELGRAADAEGCAYLVGGATAVLLGWRESTIDIDLKLVPENDRVLRELPGLKERLHINVELAAPDQFIPELPGWQERSPFVTREGLLSFRHYDLYSQALAKIERSHAQDLADVTAMLDRGLVEGGQLLALFQRIEPLLYRYPAIDEPSFRRAVVEFVASHAKPDSE